MNLRTELPTAENSSNFNAVADAATKAGTTLENLKAAVAGETGASAKYAAFAKAAKEQGFDQLARLWEATSAAEQIHINLEASLVEAEDPSYTRRGSGPRSHRPQPDRLRQRRDFRDL